MGIMHVHTHTNTKSLSLYSKWSSKSMAFMNSEYSFMNLKLSTFEEIWREYREEQKMYG
jgi:uncharacterized protein YozE (UPF0346 family)